MWEGVSPYEMLFGLLCLDKGNELPPFETKDAFLKNCTLGLSFASVNLDTRETALTKTFKVEIVKTKYCKPLTSPEKNS